MNASGKSRGVVLFAENTDTINYLAIAHRAERLINHYLDLPVTIIGGESSIKNKRYNTDSGEFEPWNNSGRHAAYELSPYDQTILLDSDYLIFDRNLLKIPLSLSSDLGLEQLMRCFFIPISLKKSITES